MDSFKERTASLLDRNPDITVGIAIINSLDRYVEHRIPTGSFLQAVLENNLTGAFSRADSENKANIGSIVAVCYDCLPHPCWGSKEKVENWLSKKERN